MSGGFDVVSSGGTASSTVVDRGGYDYVAFGGLDVGTTINGGTMEVASGGSTGATPVTFSSGGELRLDASVSFRGTVAGFKPGDFLDLADIAFGSSTTVGFSEAGNNLSGTLTVTDGMHTANILLLGQYAAAQFTSASDGHGGTHRRSARRRNERRQSSHAGDDASCVSSWRWRGRCRCRPGEAGANCKALQRLELQPRRAQKA